MSIDEDMSTLSTESDVPNETEPECDTERESKYHAQGTDETDPEVNAEAAASEHATVALEKNHLQPQQHGSNGDEERFIDQTSPQENDGRSETVTGFDPRDAPSGERVYRQGEWMHKWEWLNQLNDGVQDKNRGKRNWQAGKVNDAKLIADHLTMNVQETQKLLRMTKEVNFNNFGSYRSEQILVACASLIADENTTVYDNRIVLQEEFRELLEAFDMGSRDHQQIRQAIRERTDFF